VAAGERERERERGRRGGGKREELPTFSHLFDCQ